MRQVRSQRNGFFLGRDFATGIVWWHHLPWAFKSGLMLSIEQVRTAHRKACTRA